MPGSNRITGAIRGFNDCGCTTSTARGLPSLQGFGQTFDPCAAGPGNQPLSDEEFQCSLGVTLQPAIDEGRRLGHEFGVRPYKVFIVWEQRTRQRGFQEFCRLELMPVRIELPWEWNLELLTSGILHSGMLVLKDVSPAQVNEDILQGYLENVAWGNRDSDRKYFYEVVLHKRCFDDQLTRRRKFTLGQVPFWDAGAYNFRVTIIDQNLDRSREGEDVTVDPGTLNPGATNFPAPTLVT